MFPKKIGKESKVLPFLLLRLSFPSSEQFVAHAKKRKTPDYKTTKKAKPGLAFCAKNDKLETAK